MPRVQATGCKAAFSADKSTRQRSVQLTAQEGRQGRRQERRAAEEQYRRHCKHGGVIAIRFLRMHKGSRKWHIAEQCVCGRTRTRVYKYTHDDVSPWMSKTAFAKVMLDAFETRRNLFGLTINRWTGVAAKS